MTRTTPGRSRSRRCAIPREVTADDHAAVLKARAKRHRDLGRARNQAACRLHAVLCDLVPGGISKEITAAKAAEMLERAEPSGAVEAARCELAAEFLEDLRRSGVQMRAPTTPPPSREAQATAAAVTARRYAPTERPGNRTGLCRL